MGWISQLVNFWFYAPNFGEVMVIQKLWVLYSLVCRRHLGVLPTKLSEHLQFVGMPAMQAREWREDEREEKASLPLITWKLLSNIPRPCCAFLSQCVIQILVDYPHPYSPPGIVSGVGRARPGNGWNSHPTWRTLIAHKTDHTIKFCKPQHMHKM